MTPALIEWMTLCSEIMADTAHRMELACAQYPELLDHSEELAGAAVVVKTWIDGIKQETEE